MTDSYTPCDAFPSLSAFPLSHFSPSSITLSIHLVYIIHPVYFICPTSPPASLSLSLTTSLLFSVLPIAFYRSNFHLLSLFLLSSTLHCLYPILSVHLSLSLLLCIFSCLSLPCTPSPPLSIPPSLAHSVSASSLL